MKIPGKEASIVLALVGLLTFLYPILSLPCSITGFFQARSARRFIRINGLKADVLVNTAHTIAIIAISVTTLILGAAILVGIFRYGLIY